MEPTSKPLTGTYPEPVESKKIVTAYRWLSSMDMKAESLICKKMSFYDVCSWWFRNVFMKYVISIQLFTAQIVGV
jgi:hypothetical protein